MKRYFAMIDGEQRGPFTPEELPEAGVLPDTYVWCKGMDDWQRADEVADICRFFRCRIFDLMHPSQAAPAVTPEPEQPETDPNLELDPEDPYIFRRNRPLMEETPDTDIQPVSMLIPAIVLTLLCFPPTGFVAIYYGIMTRRSWAAAHNPGGSKDLPEDEKKKLSLEAHDYSRSAKLWTGLTFFLGIILYAFLTLRS